MSIPALYPKLYIMKMGLFPRIPRPECEAFALHRHDWQGVHEGVVQFETVRGGKEIVGEKEEEGEGADEKEGSK
jgi:hypothetical protein